MLHFDQGDVLLAISCFLLLPRTFHGVELKLRLCYDWSSMVIFVEEVMGDKMVNNRV